MAYDSFNWVSDQVKLTPENLQRMNSNIETKPGLTTEYNGQVFNDVTTNNSFNNFSVTFGTQSTSSSKAFNIVSFSHDAKSMELDSAEGLDTVTLPIECSCQLGNNYDFFGKIIRIEGNVVYFDTFVDDKATAEKSHVLWIPSRPDLGTTQVGTAAFVAGYANTGSQVGSAVFGFSNIASGKYSFIAGSSNKASYGASVLGKENIATGHMSFSVGNLNKSTGMESFTAGASNVASGVCSAVLGQSNTATGQQGTTVGYANVNNGNQSFIAGYQNTIDKGGYATPDYFLNSAIAVGRNNVVERSFGFAAGKGNHVSAEGGIALGLGCWSGYANQIAVGSYTATAGNNSAIFMVGNGTSDSNRSNAFEVLKDGQIIVKSTIQASSIKSDSEFFHIRTTPDPNTYGPDVTHEIYIGFNTGWTTISNEWGQFRFNGAIKATEFCLEDRALIPEHGRIIYDSNGPMSTKTVDLGFNSEYFDHYSVYKIELMEVYGEASLQGTITWVPPEKISLTTSKTYTDDTYYPVDSTHGVLIDVTTNGNSMIDFDIHSVGSSDEYRVKRIIGIC